MQALSFAIHIPLVCFGAGPTGARRWTRSGAPRTGDPDLRRWPGVGRDMVALFAVGVVTGTILASSSDCCGRSSWRVRRGLRARVHDRGVLVLPRGHLHRLLRLWLGSALGADAPPEAASRSWSPALGGSLMVISVNAWMNHPGGFMMHGRRVTDVIRSARSSATRPLARARAHVHRGLRRRGLLLAAVYAVRALRGHWGRYERTALRHSAHHRRRSLRRCRCSSATGPAATSRSYQPANSPHWTDSARDASATRPSTSSAGGRRELRARRHPRPAVDPVLARREGEGARARQRGAATAGRR